MNFSQGSDVAAYQVLCFALCVLPQVVTPLRRVEWLKKWQGICRAQIGQNKSTRGVKIIEKQLNYGPPNDEEEQLRRNAKSKMVSAELDDFLSYLNSPWRIVWRNMVVGLARGLGALLGATVVLGLAIWVLKIFVDLPLIGDYARNVRDRVSEVAEETRYTDDFERVQSTLEKIDMRLKEQNELLRRDLDK